MKRLYSILAFFLSFSAVILSQDFAKKGIWELGGSVGFSGSTPVYAGTSHTSEAISTFTLAPEASYFITDNFELGLKPFSFIVINAYSEHITEFSFEIAPAYNFDMKSNVYPYIQALIGYGTISTGDNYSASGFDYGIQGGVKIEVAKSSVLNFGISYLMTNRAPSGANDRYGNNIIQLLAGFSVFITQ
jgi:hypothetical protein